LNAVGDIVVTFGFGDFKKMSEVECGSMKLKGKGCPPISPNPQREREREREEKASVCARVLH
jgi:hypothetical protein